MPCSRRIFGSPDSRRPRSTSSTATAKGMFDVLANMFRSIRFLETVAEHAQERYLWPHPWTLAMESCGRPGSDYDTDTRIVTMCYEQAFDFVQLYSAYVPAKPAPIPVANTRKARSR